VPLAAAVIALATLAAYANSFQGVFVFDDEPSIQENPTIRHLWPIWPALNPPRNGETVSGRPLLNLSFAINYALGGLNPWGYHAVNLAIHILAALTLFGILRRTFLLPGVLPLPSLSNVLPLPSRERARVRGAACSPNSVHRASAATPLALAIALLWALHPLQTESVTYIVQRAESLCGLFYLLTLYCVIRGSTSLANPPSAFRLPLSPFPFPPSPFLWYSAAILVCLLGMATKEVMVTAPLVVLLYDRTFLAGSFGQALRRRWGLYLGLAATWGLLAYLVLSTGLLGKSAGYGAPEAIGAWDYLRSQPSVILHYLWLSFWPNPLCLDYGRTAIASSLGESLFATVVVGTLVSATVWGLLSRKKWALMGAWSLFTLTPTSLLPLSQPAFEHRVYLSIAGVVTVVTLGAFIAGARLLQRRVIARAATRLVAGCALILLCIALGTLTARRDSTYRSLLSTWEDAVAKAPRNHLAQYNLGKTLLALGRNAEAIEHYREALDINPRYPKAHSDIGMALAEQGKMDLAIEEYRIALEIDPKYVWAYNNLGNALVGQGRFDEGMKMYKKALEIAPENPATHYNVGNALMRDGRAAAAAVAYNNALKVNPEFAPAHNNLGNALMELGMWAGALEHFETALEMAPDCAEAYSNAGDALRRQGKATEAIRRYQQALQIRPGLPEAQQKIGEILYQRGDYSGAVAHWRDVVRLQPRAIATLNRLAWVLATNPDASIRNAEEAVAMAERAVRLSGGQDPAILDTLAAAYAEGGRFRDAAESARRGADLSASQNNPKLANKISARIKLYESGRPYRDPQ
jgi:tetratricopeptide (TPR) repeat protein